MAITYEPTPNPQTMKYNVGQILTESPVEYKTAHEALSSPLATKLFGFPWMASLFIGRDFVTITKQDWVDWDVLAEPLAELIQEHIEAGEPIFSEQSPTFSSPEFNEDPNDSAEVQTIKRVIHTEIRPAVAMDGGDVIFERFENGIVYIHMRGSCSGCPSSTMTLKMGIESRLKEAVPSITEVIALD